MRFVCIGLGLLSTGLAILGVFLPLLPTTPFLLISAACFARSSRRFYDWLHHNRLLGSYIRNYRLRRGVTRRHKIITITALWVSVLFSLVYAAPPAWVWALMLVIAASVTLHVSALKTLDKSDPE